MIIRRRVGMVVVPGITAVVLMASGCQYPVDRVAKEAFWGGLGKTSITVFPAFVRRGQSGSWDERSAQTVGAFFGDKGLATVTVSDAHVPIIGSWHSNQARMLAESAEAFASYVKAHPISTEFALMPEYLMLRSRAGGVHCYVADAQGRLAYVILQNSHWTEFAEVDPKSVDDCTEVLVRVLENGLLPMEKDE